jgi:hypothetical protein
MVIRELDAHKFQFGKYPDGEDVPGYEGPLVPPADDVLNLFAVIEKITKGPIPLSLAGFWQYVGSVNLVGYYPDWPDNTDPLWVDSPEVTLAELSEWSDLDVSDAEGFALGAVISPDVLHKDNVSGGLPYRITLPNAASDAVVLNEGRNMYFVEYLRQALDGGGFPGFESDPEVMPRWLDEISEDVRRF